MLLNRLDNKTITHKTEPISPTDIDKYSLWKVQSEVKNLRKSSIVKVLLKLEDNKWARTKEGKAEAFAQFLERVFAPNPISPDNNNEEKVKEKIYNCLCHSSLLVQTKLK